MEKLIVCASRILGSIPSLANVSMAGLSNDEPCDNGPAFGEGHTDKHERQDFAEHSRIAGHSGDTTSGGDTDADSRAAKGETDMNVTSCFCEHHNFSFYWFFVKQPF